jgi:lipopolysaccharide export system permease protein
MILLAVLIGAFKIAAFNPLSAAMLLRYEQLEAKYIKGKSSLAALSDDGLWLRQATEAGHYVLHARRISPREMRLSEVIVLMLEGNDKFIGRIDAADARLRPGYWALTGARLTPSEGTPRSIPYHEIKTDLTPENIQDSFAPPETLSFWALPRFISVLEKAGFSGLRHRLYWHTQLAVPLLLSAMVLLAATFSLRPVRRGGAGLAVVSGVATGFLLYFASDVVSALGVSARVPVVLAAWSPAVVSCLLGTAMLFHLEDG